MTDIWIYVLAGLGGAFVKLAVNRHGRILLPRAGRTEEGHLFLDLGFLASLVAGVGTALLVDQNWRIAFAAAIAGPYVVEGIPDTLYKAALWIVKNTKV